VTSIFEVIQKICEKLSYIEGYQRAWMEKHWAEIVGPAAQRHSLPRYIRNNILYVSVDSSVWNQALFMEKNQLIIKINQCFARKIISDLKFQMGNDVDFNRTKQKNELIGPVLPQVTRRNIREVGILRALLLRKKYNARDIIIKKE